MFSSLDSHVDFPTCILMAFFYNLEVAIKEKETYSSALSRCLQGEGQEDHFQIKFISEEFHLDIQNIFQNKLC